MQASVEHTFGVSFKYTGFSNERFLKLGKNFPAKKKVS